MIIRFKEIFIKNKELVLLLIIASCLSFYKLDKIPLPINQDELSNIYDAYSISTTGSDRFGNKTPLVLEGFGTADYRPALYAWLSTIPISTFGLSIITGRSISAVSYILCVLFLFLTLIKIYNKKFAILTCLIFIFSPWSWCYARIAHEGSMLPSLFLIISIFFFVKIYVEKKYSYFNFIVLGLIIGCNVNTYQTSKLISFLTAFLFFIFFIFENISAKKRKLFLLTLFCFIASLPQIYILIFFPEHFFGRFDGEKIVAENNIQLLFLAIENIYKNFSPNFLFFSSGTYNSISFSRFLAVEAIFFYIGLISISKIKIAKNKNIATIFYLILLIITIPCALTKVNPSAIRLSCMIVILPIFISAGFFCFFEKIKNKKLQQLAFFITIISIIIFFNVTYNEYKHNLDKISFGQQNHLVKIASKLNIIYPQIDTVYFEDLDNQPYIYFLYYCNIKPKTFQKMNIEHDNSEFYKFKKMGNFYFLSYDEISKIDKNTKSKSIIISLTYPKQYEIFDSINTNEGMYYFSTF